MKKINTGMGAIVFALSFLISFGSHTCLAQGEEPEGLPNIFGPTNAGTEFWFTVPPNLNVDGAEDKNIVKIIATSYAKTKITVEITGMGYYKTKNIEAFSSVEFEINPYIISFGGTSARPDGIYESMAAHVTSESPVTIHVLSRYRQSSDGFTALPAQVLGKEYIIASYNDASIYYSRYSSLPSQVGVVATENNTQVTFTLGGNINTIIANSEKYLKNGDSVTNVLNRGDIWMLASIASNNTALADLTGSKVVSNKPIAVVSANQSTNIPTDNKYRDYIVDMQLPTYSWGKTYYVGRIKGRQRSPVVRVFAKYPETTVAVNGNMIYKIKEAGGIDGEGYFELQRDLANPESFVVSGDKPIMVVLYNTGIEEDGFPEPPGDPFQVSMAPLEQFGTELMFSTPSVRGGAGFPENYINLIFKINADKTIPDDIEFGTVSNGVTTWRNIRKYDDLFAINSAGQYYAMRTLQLPYDGVYRIRDKNPISAYVYGFSEKDSYGYPAGLTLTDLQKSDSLAPVVEWSISCNGFVTGTVTDLPDDAERRANLATYVLVASSSYNYSDWSLVYDQDKRAANWQFKVDDPTRDARVIISFIDRNGNKEDVVVEYKAVKISIVPDIIDFGLLLKGDSITKEFTIINESEETEVTISKLELLYGSKGFAISPAGLPVTLSAQEESTPIEITFTALETGVFKDSIGIGDTCLFYNTSEASAIVGQPIIYVSDADLGDKTVNKPSSKPIYITNEGDYDLLITGYSGPYDNAFTIRDLPAFSIDNPLVISPGEDVEFYVDFRPNEEKRYSDTIKFENNAIVRDSIAVLSANGIKPGLEASPPYSWGRKRIHRDDFPAGPYPVDPESEAIKLENTGTENLVISDFVIISETNGNAFLFDGKPIDSFEISIMIPPGGFHSIDVEFFPKDLGLHELTIKYIDNAGSITHTRLSGFGVVPKYTISPAIFNTTIVGLEKSADKQTIRIANLGPDDWDYADTLNIIDIIPGDGVSGDWTAYGAKGFKFDKSNMPLPEPFRILPGREYEFEAAFFAPDVGDFSSEILFETDAEGDVPAILNGDGAAKGFTATSAYDSVCIGNQKIVYITIENNGNVDLTLNPLRFEDPIREFSFADPGAASKSYPLKMRTSYTVGIIFDPGSEAGLKTVRLIVEDSVSGDQYISEIAGKAYRINRTVSITPALQTIEIKQKARNSIYLNPGRDLEEADITNLKITVSFNNEFLQFAEGSLNKGPAAGSFIIDNIQIDRNNGLFSFDLSSRLVTGEPLNGSGELASFEFFTYLPHGSTQISDISVEVESFGNTCANFTPNDARVALRNICANDIFRVAFSIDEFALHEPNPNPAGTSGANIYFSLGFDVWTEINIYNVSGELVSGIVAGEYSAGLHSAAVPANQLAPGVYYYTMAAGPFLATRKLVIAK